MQMAALRMHSLPGVVLAATLAATPFFAAAQYNQQPQPYNSQDPQNYSSPAAQAYYGQQQGAAAQGYRQPDDQQRGYDAGAYGQSDGREYPDYDDQQQVYQAPPPMPGYEQPEAPGDGYIWTPGYWAWGRGGYYWVPGRWVLPPYEDALWTPGYWGYGYGGGYCWNPGYWGLAVGYYGGINYGFGYFGTGFYGGYWRNHNFFYNREYARFPLYSHNFYSQRVGFANGPHPGGQSFSTRVVVNNYRGGSYNQSGAQFHGGYNGTHPETHGFAGMQPRSSQPLPQPGQQPAGVRPGYSYAGQTGGNGGYRGQITQAPLTQQPQQRMPPMMQPGAGNFSRPAAPQGAPQSFHQNVPQQHFSAPAAQMAPQQHFSAPAAPQQHFSAPMMGGGGGAGFHGGGGGARSPR